MRKKIFEIVFHTIAGFILFILAWCDGFSFDLRIVLSALGGAFLYYPCNILAILTLRLFKNLESKEGD